MKPTNEQPRLKKTLLNILTTALWLGTVALGFVAVTTIHEAVDVQLVQYSFEQIENQEMGMTTGSGLRRVVGYATISIGVLAWIGLAIGGMEYHFKRVGTRKSLVVFAWTFGVLLALIAVSLLFRTP